MVDAKLKMNFHFIPWPGRLMPLSSWPILSRPRLCGVLYSFWSITIQEGFYLLDIYNCGPTPHFLFRPKAAPDSGAVLLLAVGPVWLLGCTTAGSMPCTAPRLCSYHTGPSLIQWLDCFWWQAQHDSRIACCCWCTMHGSWAVRWLPPGPAKHQGCTFGCGMPHLGPGLCSHWSKFWGDLLLYFSGDLNCPVYFILFFRLFCKPGEFPTFAEKSV